MRKPVACMVLDMMKKVAPQPLFTVEYGILSFACAFGGVSVSGTRGVEGRLKTSHLRNPRSSPTIQTFAGVAGLLIGWLNDASNPGSVLKFRRHGCR